MTADEFDAQVTQRWIHLHSDGQDDALARAFFGLLCDLEFDMPSEDMNPKLRQLLDSFAIRAMTYAEEHIQKPEVPK